MDSRKALKTLQELLDQDTYEKVMEVLAGSTVYFPESGRWTDKEERNQCILNDFYRGAEITTLAYKYDLSISRIYKIIQSRGGSSSD